MDKKILKKAEKVLSEADLILGGLIASQKLDLREPRTDYFTSLCRSMIGQQVSVKAASAIYERFREKTGINPKRVQALSAEDVKYIGLSRQKTAYLKDLAEHFISNPNIYKHLEKETDEKIIEKLTEVKGVGVWTAQMFLIFTLGRLDVFAPDDLGLKRAMQKLYGWKEVPKRKELVAVAERWYPYRSIACLHLWQSLHNTPQ